jgi:hypothetical protein
MDANMSWKSLLDVRDAQRATAKQAAAKQAAQSRISVREKTVLIALQRDLLSTLGWNLGDSLDLQIGEGDAAGMIRIETRKPGIKLRAPDSRRPPFSVFCLRISREFFDDQIKLPDRLASTEINPVIAGQGIEFSVPWEVKPVVDTAPEVAVPEISEVIGDPLEAIDAVVREEQAPPPPPKKTATEDSTKTPKPIRRAPKTPEEALLRREEEDALLASSRPFGPDARPFSKHNLPLKSPGGSMPSRPPTYVPSEE